MKSNGKSNHSPVLEKQDSAFVERGDLDSLIKSSGYDQKISSTYSTTDSAEGNAAALQKYGPPKPICNESRLANIEELGCMKKASGDPQIRKPPGFVPSAGCTVLHDQKACFLEST